MINQSLGLIVLLSLYGNHFIVAQDSKYSSLIGSSYGTEEFKLHYFSFSYILDNRTTRQFEIKSTIAYDFRSEIDRFGFMVMPGMNFYLKKRTPESKKLYVSGAASFFLNYYTRDYDILSEIPLETPYERWGIGILPGLGLNWQVGKILSFKLDFKTGLGYYQSQNLSCVSSVNCGTRVNSNYIDLTGFLDIGVFVRIRK